MNPAVMAAPPRLAGGDASARSKPRSGRSELACSIDLEADLYYDGDILKGTVNINAAEEGVYRNVLVLLLCRFIARDPTLTPRERCTTLHLSKYPLAAEMFIPQGETKVPFEFIIPENVPSTFSSKWGEVVWMARLIHENTDRKARMPLATLAKAIFRKRSLYYPLPGYRPTAQAERRLRNGQLLRIEASLPKDVFAPQEPVEVSVVVHQTCSAPSKKQPKLAVTQVKAKIFQSIEAQKNGKKQVSKRYLLDESKHASRSWPVTAVEGEHKGILSEKTFSMHLSPDPRHKCAHCHANDGKSLTLLEPSATETVLAATCKLRNAQTNSGLEVRYEVVLKFGVTGGSDLTLTLPFIIESPRPKAVEAASAEEATADITEELRDRIVFPILDDPPEYKRHRATSVPSYTSLRRFSLDSVFGSASQLEATPSYADIISQDELGYDTVRRHSLVDRRSFGDISSQGEPDHSGAASGRSSVAGVPRRNSFSALPLPWRRRSSAGLVDAHGHNTDFSTPAIADSDEDKEQEGGNMDHLAMLKLKYSNVPDRGNPHGPHTLSEDAIRQLPSDSTLADSNW